MTAILVGMQWCLIVVYIDKYNIEHLFMCLFSFCMSSLGKCSFEFFAHF